MSTPVLGRLCKDIAPGANNPRNSEGAFLPLSGGRLMFCYSAFYGNEDDDHSSANIAKIVSCDGGLTWSSPEVIATCAAHGAMNIMSVSLMRMQNGDVGLFYLVRQTFSDMRPVLRRSSDEGETWSESTMCIPRIGYFVLNNDRAIRLQSGRILLPVAEHVPTFGTRPYPHYSRATSTFFYSDDDGHIWRECDACVALSGIRSPVGLQEPGALEKRNGDLWAWARTDLGRQYEFFSLNGGSDWTHAAPSRFTSPMSPLSMKRMPDGRLLAVWNPIPNYETRVSAPKTGGRHPLVCAVSADDGESWSSAHAIEDDPMCGFCYTAMEFVEGGVMLAYCAGDSRVEGSCLNRLRIVKIPYTELPE